MGCAKYELNFEREEPTLAAASRKISRSEPDIVYSILLVGSVVTALPVAILLLETIAAISGGEQALGLRRAKRPALVSAC
jgi:hypothetical protein